MKFEQFLLIYWSRYLVALGKAGSFNVYPVDFLNKQYGFKGLIVKKYLYRFELYRYFFFNREIFLSNTSFFVRYTLNIFLSRLFSINHNPYLFNKYSIIRKYMNRSRIGKSHGLGKPVRGQRTWSNANNAYLVNTLARKFVNDIKKTITVKAVPTKIDYKKIKKKQKRTKRAFFVKFKKPTTVLWF